MTTANRVALILRSQYHAANAAALKAQTFGNNTLARDLRDAAEYCDLLAEAVDDGLLAELRERALKRRLFEANGLDIDFSAYTEAQLGGHACSSCGTDLKPDEWTETTLLSPVGRMRRHRKWQDCDVEVPF